MPEQLARQYDKLRRIATQALGGPDIAVLICEMAAYARGLLNRAERITLTSRVADKRYFGYRGQAPSRPINEDLYAEGDDVFNRLLEALRAGFRDTSEHDIVRSTYTAAYSVFAANEIHAVGRKASATFFEILIGHIVARAVAVAPRKKVVTPETGKPLPTDFVFDPGPTKRKLHLPIKTITRERAVQAWAHQQVLESIFGREMYCGVLVVASETKLNSKTGEVIEICVPQQWQMFQDRLAHLSRVYYLDPPAIYLALAESNPRVEVRSFGEVPRELPGLLEP